MTPRARSARCICQAAGCELPGECGVLRAACGAPRVSDGARPAKRAVRAKCRAGRRQPTQGTRLVPLLAKGRRPEGDDRRSPRRPCPLRSRRALGDDHADLEAVLDLEARARLLATLRIDIGHGRDGVKFEARDHIGRLEQQDERGGLHLCRDARSSHARCAWRARPGSHARCKRGLPGAESDCPLSSGPAPRPGSVSRPRYGWISQFRQAVLEVLITDPGRKIVTPSGCDRAASKALKARTPSSSSRVEHWHHAGQAPRRQDLPHRGRIGALPNDITTVAAQRAAQHLDGGYPTCEFSPPVANDRAIEDVGPLRERDPHAARNGSRSGTCASESAETATAGGLRRVSPVRASLRRPWSDGTSPDDVESLVVLETPVA